MDTQATSDKQSPRSTESGTADARPDAPGDSSAKPPAPGWTPSQFKPDNFASMRRDRHKVSNTSASAVNKARNVREYTLGEEIANSITHGIGALLAIAAIPILVVRAIDDGGGVYLFAALVYTLTMLLEYTMSTLYHAIAVDRAKKVFKILDHSCIYLFIAGSYTPFCLISLADHGGMWLCLFVWAVGLAGVACEAFWVFRPRWISALLYLLMGWCVVWFLPVLVSAIPAQGLWLLVGGGVCYSIGCIFYVLKKIPYMHSIFHLWVLAGSVLQFLAIALYVM
jgi:hemolysin III